MASTTRRKPAPTETVEQPDAPAVQEDTDLAPRKIGKKDKKSVLMVDVFELDGVMYRIPAKPGPAATIRYLREASNPKIGQQQAGFNYLTTLLGADAMQALSESPDVDDEDMAQVWKIVAHVAFQGSEGLTTSQGN